MSQAYGISISPSQCFKNQTIEVLYEFLIDISVINVYKLSLHSEVSANTLFIASSERLWLQILFRPLKGSFWSEKERQLNQQLNVQ